MNTLADGMSVFMEHWGLITGILGFVAILALPIYYRFKSDPEPVAPSTSLFLSLFLFISILLRLAYVSKAIFPLYFDSAQHYTLTKNILSNSSSWMFNFLSVSYYHLGFHFLTAFFTSVFRVEITQVMLVLGQVILAFIPLPLFFLAGRATKSDSAGRFALVLAAFGWYMPAHAVDWGKYPALMSVGMISFVLMLAFLFSQNNSEVSKLKRWTLYGLLSLGMLLTVFTHSRSLIVFGIVFVSWVISARWEKLSQRQMTVIFLAIVVLTTFEAVFLLRQSILVLLFDPYLQNGYLITGLVMVLSIFAWMAYPRLTFVNVLAITFLLASVFIPVTWIPGYRDLTLLDRPYVEMILFLPLSLLGGLGLSGLEKILRERFSWGRLVGLLAIGIVAVNAFFNYDFYPSACCVIVGNDDVVGMEWVANQLPVDARIGISSTQLKVISETSEGDVGADAGIWITPLTRRVTIPLPYNTDFNDSVTWKIVCEKRIGYLFVGEVGYPFDSEEIDTHPERYRPLLSMPKTRVYEVVGCN